MFFQSLPIIKNCQLIRLIHSDVYAGLNYLPDNSVDIAITSPPYWGQRDYGFIGQIGCEDDYKEYIGKLIAIFRVLKDKLKDDSVFFLNIGDKYIPRYGKSSLGLIPYKIAYFVNYPPPIEVEACKSLS